MNMLLMEELLAFFFSFLPLLSLLKIQRQTAPLLAYNYNISHY